MNFQEMEQLPFSNFWILPARKRKLEVQAIG